jgi:hypothetical protein
MIPHCGSLNDGRSAISWCAHRKVTSIHINREQRRSVRPKALNSQIVAYSESEL